MPVVANNFEDTYQQNHLLTLKSVLITDNFTTKPLKEDLMRQHVSVVR